jgi:hypothetical protein
MQNVEKSGGKVYYVRTSTVLNAAVKKMSTTGGTTVERTVSKSTVR